MKNLKKSIIAGTFALCLLVGASYATTASYNDAVAKLNLNKTYATGTKSSSSNQAVFHHLQASPGVLRFWVDAKTGSWKKVTGNHDFGSGYSKHFSYLQSTSAGKAVRLRGRSLSTSSGGKTAKGYVDFN